jgi:hypothetical protein
MAERLNIPASGWASPVQHRVMKQLEAQIDVISQALSGLTDTTSGLLSTTSGLVSTTSGLVSTTGELVAATGELAGTTSSLVDAAGRLILVKPAQLFAETILIEFADNKEYPLVLSSPVAWKVTKVTTQCATGTCTAAIYIGATPLGGGSNAVSTTLATVTHTTANELAVGQPMVLLISGNAGAEMVSVTLAVEQALATL